MKDRYELDDLEIVTLLNKTKEQRLNSENKDTEVMIRCTKCRMERKGLRGRWVLESCFDYDLSRLQFSVKKNGLYYFYFEESILVEQFVYSFIHSFIHSWACILYFTLSVTYLFICVSFLCSNKHDYFLSSLAFSIAGGSGRLNGRNLIPPIHGCNTSGISTPSLV